MFPLGTPTAPKSTQPTAAPAAAKPSAPSPAEIAFRAQQQQEWNLTTRMLTVCGAVALTGVVSHLVSSFTTAKIVRDTLLLGLGLKNLPIAPASIPAEQPAMPSQVAPPQQALYPAISFISDTISDMGKKALNGVKSFYGLNPTQDAPTEANVVEELPSNMDDQGSLSLYEQSADPDFPVEAPSPVMPSVSVVAEQTPQTPAAPAEPTPPNGGLLGQLWDWLSGNRAAEQPVSKAAITDKDQEKLFEQLANVVSQQESDTPPDWVDNMDQILAPKPKIMEAELIERTLTELEPVYVSDTTQSAQLPETYADLSGLELPVQQPKGQPIFLDAWSEAELTRHAAEVANDFQNLGQAPTVRHMEDFANEFQAPEISLTEQLKQFLNAQTGLTVLGRDVKVKEAAAVVAVATVVVYVTVKYFIPAVKNRFKQTEETKKA